MERTAVRRVARRLWRVVERDGEPVSSWLPGLEEDDRPGALDRGGFDQYSDARAFSLGVDHERAFHGHLTGTTAMDIDREREALDLPCVALDVVAAIPKANPPEGGRPVNLSNVTRVSGEHDSQARVVARLKRDAPEVISAAEQERRNLDLKRRLQLHRVA
jgi:hypothetical protein